MVEKDEEMEEKPPIKPKDGTWKLYVAHPRFGPFEVHEGVVAVADRFLVSVVGRIGFMSITMPAEVRRAIQILAMQTWDYNAPVHFTVLDALFPTVAHLDREIFSDGDVPVHNPEDPVA